MKNLYDNPIPLYHWSPTTRRKSIVRKGLVPSSRSVDGLWKPPYICYAESPRVAWELSGNIHNEIPEWDLWMTWSNIPKGLEIRPYDLHPEVIKEVRIYERIYKRDLWYVATRTNERYKDETLVH